MKCGNGYIQGYNAQAAVDSKHQVIVAIGVSNQAPDVEHLVPMLERIDRQHRHHAREFIADAGYWSEANAKACSDRASMPTSPPGARSMASSEHHHGVRSQRSRRQRDNGPQAQKQERPRGLCQAQGDRRAGVWSDQRKSRSAALPAEGLEKVNGEWSLMSTGHNLLKLFRFSWAVHKGPTGPRREPPRLPTDQGAGLRAPTLESQQI